MARTDPHDYLNRYYSHRDSVIHFDMLMFYSYYELTTRIMVTLHDIL